MDDPKQRVIDSLKQATNILVTVRKNPSIDQLSACLALTLIINELDKHGTAVFSGQVPSTLEFLQPDKTIERNTDSLQDFIISLDKAKADKLRYKVEDTVVKIYITPYRTSLSNKDLEFGQGDFNVDVVVALGVHEQADVDDAITAHGRILHDATVISINTDAEANKDLGSISWVDSSVSSLSEMIFDISGQLGKEDAVDNQTATALLTGIVAETERFGNAKTTPATMEAAARLLTAGANQELVASKLSEPAKPQPIESSSDSPNDLHIDNDSGAISNQSDSQASNDNQPAEPAADPKNGGELDIEHVASEPQVAIPSDGTPPVYSPQQQGPYQAVALPAAAFVPPLPPPPAPEAPVGAEPAEEQAALDFLKGRKVETNMRGRIEPLSRPIIESVSDQNGYLDGIPQHDADEDTKFALTPPSFGGTLTASMDAEQNTPASTSMMNSQPPAVPLLDHDKVSSVPPAPATPPAPAPATPPAPAPEALITPQVPQNQPDQAAPLPAAVSTPSPAPSLASPAHQTLADLEQQMHARHAAEAKAAATPSGAMDMPKPPAAPTVPLPSPLIEPLTTISMPSSQTAPPPVPPPMPPLPA